jgi:beta-N-acetylhexosaminidase
MGAACSAAPQDEGAQPAPHVAPDDRVENLLAAMSVEQKIAQMIIPAIRTWESDEANVYDLGSVPGLAEALRKHQYGGIILFGQNIKDSEQTVRLVSDLQANNAQSDDAKATGVIPYYIAADQEGGSVARISMGTRGTGSMAIGAAGAEQGYQNARDTGTIFGVELSALGINVNLGPCVDVITDPTDLGMSTRVFSDDPEMVGDLSQGFADGVAKNNIITCFKHFPGAGDGSDYPTAIYLTLDELRAGGLTPYTSVIESGADMVMVAATTFPAFDDEQVLADGKTKGFYPATMSPKIVGQLLREELGFDGVVMTDALEMDQFFEEPETGDKILPGEKCSVETGIIIAEKCIAAGCDILLIPTDLNSRDAVQWYEDYIAGIAAKVADGSIDEGRIDESVRRILDVKEQYGVFETDVEGAGLDESIARAQESVGSERHHAIEREIAEQAVTLLKGDERLPVPGSGARIVILGRTVSDSVPISYALRELQDGGVIDPQVRVINHITGEDTGSKDADMRIFVGCYYDLGTGELSYADKISKEIAKAQYVICLSATTAGLDKLQDSDGRMQGITRALEEAHAAGATFVLLSDSLPYDVARFPEADVAVCSYLSSGFDVDPTTGSGSENMPAINANVPAALRAIFGAAGMPGELPINVPVLQQDKSGAWAYADEILYPRGSGLKWQP